MGWREEAIRRGHKIDTCGCVSCIQLRGERVPASIQRGRKKTADRRGYLWLSHEDDKRVHDAADLLGTTCGAFVREAIQARLDQVESEITGSLEVG